MVAMGSRRQTLTVGGLCVCWYVLSAASNVIGKLALSALAAPLTATLAQLVAAVALSALTLRILQPRAPSPPPRYRRALLPLAAAKLATMLLSQIAIWRMPVSYAHTVKATTPLWTALISYLVWGERQTARVLAALALIAGGVALASLTELQADAGGLLAALGAAALLAAQHLYSKRALAAAPHPLLLLRELSFIAMIALIPLWALLEAGGLWESGITDNAGALLAADAVLAWLQAGAALALLARISPLAYGVASSAKRAAVVAGSLIVLRNPAPPLNIAGMALAAVGVLAYNRAKASSRTLPPDKEPLLPM